VDVVCDVFGELVFEVWCDMVIVVFWLCCGWMVIGMYVDFYLFVDVICAM